MTPVQTAAPWDFSQVLELINTLSPANGQSKDMAMRPPMKSRATLSGPSSLPTSSPLDALNDGQEGVSLGNFGKIWEYLGTPVPSPAPQAAADTSPTLQQRMPEKADYTSDGAVYGTPSKRIAKGSIKWRDEANAGDLTDYAPQEEAKKLSKKQRQKKNKKERERLAAQATKSVSDIESEAEGPMPHYSPARKASTHHIQEAAPSSSSPVKTPTKSSRAAQPPRPASPVKTPNKPSNIAQAIFDNAVDAISAESRPVKKASTPQSPSKHEKKPLAPLDTLPKTPEPKSQKKDWPTSKPFPVKTSPLLPSSVQPVRQVAPSATKPFQKVQTVSETPTKNNRHAIQPKTVRSGEDRNWALLLKIIADFYEDRACLVSPATMVHHSNDPRGIHVFVDASNIFIGFHDELKRARDIPQHFYVPRVDLSFDALALLMERRRPVAKRCLVGSKPHIAAFDVAQKIGYECNILDKVLKARELTERQKYFQEQDNKLRRRNSARKNANNSTGESGGSGSETSTAVPQFAPEKFVEQGVDEILHLKMMESIVDTDEPSTIVLATGDAAQAEYSQGFLKMAERALKKGWKVELVTWSKNTSSLYKKAAWRKQWHDRFKIIELDSYAEELLDM